MSIVPPLGPSCVADALTAALSRADGCPEACQNTEMPRAAIPIDRGWRTSYLCSDCGTAWTTDWRDDS
jgi:hypothetical protein